MGKFKIICEIVLGLTDETIRGNRFVHHVSLNKLLMMCREICARSSTPRKFSPLLKSAFKGKIQHKYFIGEYPHAMHLLNQKK
jgi:hypothetical protein